MFKSIQPHPKINQTQNMNRFESKKMHLVFIVADIRVYCSLSKPLSLADLYF